MAWNTRSIFISSTFADMQSERDHLRTHVFPALEERLRARRHNLEWVDLRMGVATASLTEGEARELQVLKVCLAEVRRCRPFLIVLLGDRYGWVPPADRIAAAAREEGLEFDTSGRSVTDLEVSFGILDDLAQQPRCFFYFRQLLSYSDLPPNLGALYADVHATDPGATERTARLVALKHRIVTSMPSRVRPYTVQWDAERQQVIGLDVWGRQVLEDIWSELEADTAAATAEPEPSWQQSERDALDAYVDDRARGFIGRQAVLTRLLDHAALPLHESAIFGVCLTGAPGSGKSAVFSELLRRIQATDAFVLAHASGASPMATSVPRMLRRWIEELAAVLGVPSELAEDANAETIEATFRKLLAGVAANKRVVLAVDALDQFEPTMQGRHVTWLPHLIPANVRFIATAIPGEASEALRQRPGMEALSLAPLDADEARSIAVAICARYRRTLELDVLRALLDKRSDDDPAWGNPLWLVLAVEELNLIDADGFARASRSYSGAPAEQLRALMVDLVVEMPADIAGLYRAGFARAEKLFGLFLARAFIGFIAVSRAGWRETDLRLLLPRLSGEEWEELGFASLRRLFRGQLRQVGTAGRWDFAHSQMRAAARAHLASQSVSETEFHAEAAGHLLQLPRTDPLRQTEAMVHLVGSEDWAAAARYFGDPELDNAELAGGRVALAGRLKDSRLAAAGMRCVERMLDTCIESQLPPEVIGLLAERLFNLDELLGSYIPLHLVNELHERMRRSFSRILQTDPDNTRWQIHASTLHNKVGDLLLAQGDAEGAFAAYRDVLVIRQRLSESKPDHVGWKHALAMSYLRMGDVGLNQEDWAVRA